MDKTKIDWATASWNPITGCFHDCKYCYARNQARRFQGCYDPVSGENIKQDESGIIGFEHTGRLFFKTKKGKIIAAPYPYGFAPTFHSHRLAEPCRVKNPQNIFVCSMADLFGDWVPDKWIQAVFDACEAAPWHNYLFLTKNWMHACEYRYKPNWWIGRTITHDEPCGNSDKNLYLCYGVPNSVDPTWQDHPNKFISIEPIQSAIPDLPYYAHEYGYKWVIVGAETGNRKDKIIPKREWIEKVVEDCKRRNIPVFMKSSLAGIWGEPLIQEYPPQLLTVATSMKGGI